MFVTILIICVFMYTEGLRDFDIEDFPSKNSSKDDTDNGDEPMKKLITVNDYHECALKKWPFQVSEYVDNGSDFGHTLRENTAAFQRYQIRPRLLTKVGKIDLTTKFFKDSVSFPVGIAPTAMHQLYCPERELATAKAAQNAEVVMVLSVLSTSSIKEVREAAPTAVLWMEMYPFKNRTINQVLIKEAEKYNFKGIVLNIDSPVRGRMLNEIQNDIQIPHEVRFKVFEKALGLNEPNLGNAIFQYFSSYIDDDFTWNDVWSLKQMTKLPIIAKGVLTGPDAYNAYSYGFDGIIVSNHGGRQLDGAPATIDVLPEIMKSVKGYLPVYIDSGIRSGIDVFKALALGANGVFVGRPVVWGLGCDCKVGAEGVLATIHEELIRTMKLAGSAHLGDFEASQVVRQIYYDHVRDPKYLPK